MNWQISLAITVSVVALVFASFQWGRTHEKNNAITADNKALIEYVKSQKTITDKYGPIFDKLKTLPKTAVDPAIDYALDQLPNPKHKNK